MGKKKNKKIKRNSKRKRIQRNSGAARSAKGTLTKWKHFFKHKAADMIKKFIMPKLEDFCKTSCSDMVEELSKILKKSVKDETLSLSKREDIT